MKTIKISQKNWRMLNKFKYNYGYKNLDEIISKLLEITPSIELKNKKEKEE